MVTPMSTINFEFLHPDNWVASKGYTNGVAAEGRQVFVAGQVGWNDRAKFESDDFVAQVEQALSNVMQILVKAGGKPSHLVRLNWYLTDKAEYVARQKEVGEAYRRVIGRHFSAMTLLIVAGLLEVGAKVEIEATAVIPK
jgi:enamine deaminase RidA (YjgF/YER057c/UK114 family)